ncbi:alpha/beta fold hydrolase [Leptolyngbya sp. BL0902]|uniref:alpha/beta fold hydrolase n=1 Tax=Leptolyngbya sp. BL0902 TaxID=1115757 RepID=UPI0018E7DEA8|nr:alpha/beta hydrolase [Leptolyngbya sp. BL0902]
MSDTLHLLTPTEAQPHKPLLVYLPGLDGSGRLFDHQVPALHRSFEVRCLALPKDDRSSWHRLVEQTIDLLVATAAGRPIYLCGESFGACLALQVVAQAPDLAHRLILVNSASAFHRLPWLTGLGSITAWVPSSIFPFSTLGSMPLLANLNRIAPAQRHQLFQAVQAVPQATVAWRMDLLAQFRLDALNLAAWTAPTLLLASLADRLLPSLEEAHRLLAVFPQAQIYPLPYSGHASLLEETISLSQILAETGFLPQFRPVFA